MRALAVALLACLACTTARARRVQVAAPLLQPVPHAASEDSPDEMDAVSNSHSFVEVGSSVRFHPSAAAVAPLHARAHVSHPVFSGHVSAVPGSASLDARSSSRISHPATSHEHQHSAHRSRLVTMTSGGEAAGGEDDEAEKASAAGSDAEDEKYSYVFEDEGVIHVYLSEKGSDAKDARKILEFQKNVRKFQEKVARTPAREGLIHRRKKEKKGINPEAKDEAKGDEETAERSDRRGIFGFIFLLAAAVIDKFGTAPPGTPAVATPPDAKSGGVESEVSLKGTTGFNRFRLACWKFVRPHTIRGTILGSSAVTLRCIMENPTGIDWALLPRAVLGVLCLLCGNGYIVGINQIYDVDMDTINKPFLPIAAGELSKPAAWALCAVFAAMGLGISAMNFGSLITGLYAFGLLLGTVYSVPPLRLKRFPVPAFLIIAIVRGFLLNFGVYYAARAAMQLPFAWSPTILFATCFVTWFATVIAVSKDLPDIEGDKATGVETFAVKLGADKLSYISAGMLVALYSVGAALPVLFPASFRLWLMTPLNSIIAVLIVRAALRLRSSNWSQPGIKAYYRFVWSIFYTSYVFLPFLAPLPKVMRLA